MSLPRNEVLTIAAYRDFHDVPRLILAGDASRGFWIMDCPFDHDVDDYASGYGIYAIDSDPVTAREIFDAWPVRASDAGVEIIPVDRVRFNETRRATVKCV